MSDDYIQEALDEWLHYKAVETEAKEFRQKIENYLAKHYGYKETEEGTKSFDEAYYQVKMVQRMTRKVDTETLERCAVEAGAQDHLKTLFRWKPEINLKEWKNTDPKITQLFLPAITTTPGRPSFKIIKKDDE